MSPATLTNHRRELLRVLVVAVTALAWLFPSVRCAMGCAVPLASPLPSCCAQSGPHDAPVTLHTGNDKGGEGGGDFCREVRANFSKKEFARVMLAPVVLAGWDLDALLSAAPERAALTAPATSPPVASFAERILQESLFAHAPPHSR